MRNAVVLILCLAILSVFSGCSGSGSGGQIPQGATMFISPSTDLAVDSASSVVQKATQNYLISSRDASATSTGTTGSTTATTPNGPVIRDVTFSVTFDLTNPPDPDLVPSTASLVTLCDGSRIIGTQVAKVTGDDGTYPLCISYETGGGLAYEGNLRITSGDQSPSVSLKVTRSASLQALAVSPASQTVPAGSTGQFAITGGIPKYTVTASPAGILPAPIPSTVTSSGGTFSVTVPLGTPDGTAVTYVITDAAGAQVSATLTVGKPSSQPEVFPSAASVFPGGSVQFTVLNGFAPYSIFSSSSQATLDKTRVTTSGGTFTVTVADNTPPGPVTLTVLDSANTSVNVTLTVLSPPTLTISPQFVTVTSGTSPVPVKFSIIGGIAPYVVTTSDAAIIATPSTVLSSGGTFSITVPANTAAETITVTVTDVTGASIQATITVAVPQPLSAALSQATIGTTGGQLSLTITGGTPPYTATSSDTTHVHLGTPGAPSVSGITSGSPVMVTVDNGLLAGTVITFNITDAVNTLTTVTLTVQ